MAVVLVGCARQPDDLRAVREVLDQLNRTPSLTVLVYNESNPNVVEVRYERHDGVEWLDDRNSGHEVWSDGRETYEFDHFRGVGAVYPGRPAMGAGASVMPFLALDGSWTGYRVPGGFEAQSDGSVRRYTLGPSGEIKEIQVSSATSQRRLRVEFGTPLDAKPKPSHWSARVFDVDSQRKELLAAVAGPGVEVRVGENVVRVFGCITDESNALAVVYAGRAPDLLMGLRIGSERAYRPLGAGLVSTLTRDQGPILVSTIVDVRVPRDLKSISVRCEAPGERPTNVEAPILFRTYRLGYVVGPLVPDPSRVRGR